MHQQTKSEKYVGTTLDTFGLMELDELFMRIRVISNDIDSGTLTPSEQKKLEVELAWHLREKQIRDQREAIQKKYIEQTRDD